MTNITLSSGDEQGATTDTMEWIITALPASGTLYLLEESNTPISTVLTTVPVLNGVRPPRVGYVANGMYVCSVYYARKGT